MTPGQKAMRAAIAVRMKQDGFTIQPITGLPPFVYSIGLTEKLGYDLIAVGVNHLASCPIMMSMVHDLVEGATLELDTPTDKYSNFPIKLMEVKNAWAAPYAVVAYEYNEKAKFRQIVFTDRTGKFPGEEGYHFAKQKVLY